VLDQMLIFGRRLLDSVLVEFIDHYNQARPHQEIEQRRPCEPAVVVPLPTEPVERRDRLSGIIHEYSRAA
jgi:putative transposase